VVPVTEQEEQEIEETLKTFLFKKLTPNLMCRVREAMGPVVDRIAERRMGTAETEEMRKDGFR